MPTKVSQIGWYYLPPPDRQMVARGSHESVHYFTLAPGPEVGPGPAVTNFQRPIISVPEHSPHAGERAVDSVTAPPVVGEPEADSVFTILEVDSAVVRSQSSAAPAYPLDLLTKKVQGSVNARYVVDTTGFADTTSFEVLASTNEGFVRAVRDALPYMRFTSAKIGTRKVRQIVEQSFTFQDHAAESYSGGAKAVASGDGGRGTGDGGWGKGKGRRMASSRGAKRQGISILARSIHLGPDPSLRSG